MAVDTDHISLAGRTAAQALDSYVFVAGKSAVRDVMVGGRWVIEKQRHAQEDAASSAYRDVVRKTLHG